MFSFADQPRGHSIRMFSFTIQRVISSINKSNSNSKHLLTDIRQCAQNVSFLAQNCHIQTNKIKHLAKQLTILGTSAHLRPTNNHSKLVNNSLKSI